MRLVLRRFIAFSLIAAGAIVLTVIGSEWPEVRGPNRDGVSPEKNLPEKWSLAGENLLWRAPYGATSAPVALGDRVYLQTTTGQGAALQDRVVCLDANTGKLVWEKSIPVNQSEKPGQHDEARPSPAIDLETGSVFVITGGGRVAAYTRDGMPLWMRSLTEEFGFQIPENGRIASPVVDEANVIVSGITFNWGDLAEGANRFLALDKRTGETIWVSSPGKRVYDANNSPPIIMDSGGTRLLIAGASDGAWHAIQASTGRPVWRYEVSKRALNSAALHAGDKLIVTDGEESGEGNTSGFMAAIDAAVSGEVTRNDAKWIRAGFRASSPAVTDGQRIYLIDDTATLAAFNVSNGDQLWKAKLGAGAKAAPVLADGKLYVGGADGKFYIVRPRADGADILSEVTLGSPNKPEHISAGVAVSNGRVYLVTSEALYALANVRNTVPAWRPVTVLAPDRSPAFVQVIPADVAVNTGQTVKFRVRLLDSKGNLVREVTPPATEPQPQSAKPPATQQAGQRGQQSPPAEKPPSANTQSEMQWSLEQIGGTVQPDGSYTAPSDGKPSGGKVKVRVSNLTGEARVRVISPAWETTFEDVEVGSVPVWWLNARGSFGVKAIDGNRVLAKLPEQSSGPARRVRTFLGLRTMTNYTVQADVRFASLDSMPAAGILAQGYELVLSGQRLDLRQPLPETGNTTSAAMNATANEWQRLKLEVEILPDGSVRARGKAWRANEQEPEKWNVERTEKPRLTLPAGSPGLYADAAAEVYFDNLKVIPKR